MTCVKNRFYFVFAAVWVAVISSASDVSAQLRTRVTGEVLSADNQKPLPGVTVMWKKNGLSSVTNDDGKFVILLPVEYTPSDSLTFSSIGYRSSNLCIPTVAGQQEAKVALVPAVEQLQEVAVKPLSVIQLLDSVVRHNKAAFAAPVKLNGYYREFVFTNEKCTQFSDAVGEFYYDRHSASEGLLKINASRCLRKKEENKSKDNIEIYRESKVNPNEAFRFALFSFLIDKYFPEKLMKKYDYKQEKISVPNSAGYKVEIFPAKAAKDAVYNLTLLLDDDFTLQSYHLEIPENFASYIDEKSLLGIHTKLTGLEIDVKYATIEGEIYPHYFSVSKTGKIWGKMLGATINETEHHKSEFVVTSRVKCENLKSLPKNEIYKKGNLCSNGVAINDEILKNFTVIMPSAQESEIISNLQD